MLTRLELILKVDRPEHTIAKQEAPLVSSQLFRLGLGSPNVAAASIVDAQQYRFSTHCRRLEAYAFSGSLGGHVSGAGLNNDNAGSRDRIQPDNPATIERDIESAIARIGDGIEVRRNRMAASYLKS